MAKKLAKEVVKRNVKPRKYKNVKTPFVAGNQFGAGTAYDIEEEARALDEWSKRDDALAFVGFCVERDIYAQRIYDWVAASEQFKAIYNKAKVRIANRMRLKLHDKDNPYNYGLFMREVHHHDKFLNDAEDRGKDDDVRRTKETAQNLNEGFTTGLKSVFDMFNSLKKDKPQSSDLNIDENNMSMDT